jgi:uncharacterized protein YciI
MQYLVTAYDGTDAEAPARRKATRPAHLALTEKLRDTGKLLIGAALMNDAGEMCGSAMLFNFADEAELQQWLKDEPFVQDKVWETINITPCALSPTFGHFLQPKAPV